MDSGRGSVLLGAEVQLEDVAAFESDIHAEDSRVTIGFDLLYTLLMVVAKWNEAWPVIELHEFLRK
ncbi:hypothetical protein GCM10011585_33830 [Edaphobacter dinghuensis]|uniref:Uncharacterized protein n=1 Tax=Edaphobacter dinghuensis TaxID=1560005 RepID=A0A917HQ67_9BACT|nr:hypothetical protein GCM10011585_33830 [Edaphobacter dinghuensis]